MCAAKSLPGFISPKKIPHNFSIWLFTFRERKLSCYFGVKNKKPWRRLEIMAMRSQFGFQPLYPQWEPGGFWPNCANFLHTWEKLSKPPLQQWCSACVGVISHAPVFVCSVCMSIGCITVSRGRVEKSEAESQDLRPLRKRAVWSKTCLARPPHTADEL